MFALYSDYSPCDFDRRAQGLFGGPCFFRRSDAYARYVYGFNLNYRTLKEGPSMSTRHLERVRAFSESVGAGVPAGGGVRSEGSRAVADAL